MGYTTYYEIYEYTGDEWRLADYDRLTELGFEEDSEAFWEDAVKWYDWKEDMTEISRRNPGVRLLITGNGEESADLWRTFFLDGVRTVQTPEIVWPVVPEEFGRAAPEPGT